MVSSPALAIQSILNNGMTVGRQQSRRWRHQHYQQRSQQSVDPAGDYRQYRDYRIVAVDPAECGLDGGKPPSCCEYAASVTLR